MLTPLLNAHIAVIFPWTKILYFQLPTHTSGHLYRYPKRYMCKDNNNNKTRILKPLLEDLLNKYLNKYISIALMLIKHDTYRSHVTIPLGKLPCQTKVQHKTRMATVWRTTHGKIGLKIKQHS